MELRPLLSAGPSSTLVGRRPSGPNSRQTRSKKRRVFGQEERQATVVLAQTPTPDEDDLPRGCDGVELSGAVAVQTRRQNVCLEYGGWEDGPLKLFDDVEQGVGTGGRRDRDALPGEQ
jgi:hypothetical protein